MIDNNIRTAIAQARVDDSIKRNMATAPFAGEPGRQAMTGVKAEAVHLIMAVAEQTRDGMAFDIEAVEGMDNGQLDEIVRHEMMHALVGRNQEALRRREIFNAASDAIVETQMAAAMARLRSAEG